MQLLNISKLPIYLPYDTAPVPFGDPFSGATVTSAAPGVFTVKGYTPTQNAAVQLSVSGGAILDTAFAAGVSYYVTSISATAGTFSLSTAKNGTGQSTVTTMLQAGGSLTVHLVSNQVDGTVCPFKTGASVVAMNLGTATVFLQGAPDLNTTTYGNPTGPGAAVQLVAGGIAPGNAAIVTLSQDWLLTTSAGPGTLVLLQN